MTTILPPAVLVPLVFRKFTVLYVTPATAWLPAVAVKFTVPLLCTKEPAFVKFPPMESSVEGAVTDPVVIVRFPVVVAEFAPKVQDPPEPLKVTFANDEDVATMDFVAVEVEVKVTVPV